MSESPTKYEEGKGTPPIETTLHGDVERGDLGIKNHAAPLARELKGRHLQMIALGMLRLVVFIFGRSTDNCS